jgi:hypothetical protein
MDAPLIEVMFAIRVFAGRMESSIAANDVVVRNLEITEFVILDQCAAHLNSAERTQIRKEYVDGTFTSERQETRLLPINFGVLSFRRLDFQPTALPGEPEVGEIAQAAKIEPLWLVAVGDGE